MSQELISREDSTMSLTSAQLGDIINMINDLYKSDGIKAFASGNEFIKFEIETKGAYFGKRVEVFGVIWCLCYIIPKKLNLQSVIVDVNHKPGLYEYVFQKYNEFKAQEKAIVRSLTADEDWPDFPIDACC